MQHSCTLTVFLTSNHPEIINPGERKTHQNTHSNGKKLEYILFYHFQAASLQSKGHHA